MLISSGSLGLFPGINSWCLPVKPASRHSCQEPRPRPRRDTSLGQPTSSRPPSLPGLLAAAVSMAQASAHADGTGTSMPSQGMVGTWGADYSNDSTTAPRERRVRAGLGGWLCPRRLAHAPCVSPEPGTAGVSAAMFPFHT